MKKVRPGCLVQRDRPVHQEYLETMDHPEQEVPKVLLETLESEEFVRSEQPLLFTNNTINVFSGTVLSTEECFSRTEPADNPMFNRILFCILFFFILGMKCFLSSSGSIQLSFRFLRKTPHRFSFFG